MRALGLACLLLLTGGCTATSPPASPSPTVESRATPSPPTPEASQATPGERTPVADPFGPGGGKTPHRRGHAYDPFGGSRHQESPTEAAAPLPPAPSEGDQGPVRQAHFSSDADGKQGAGEFPDDTAEVFLRFQVEGARKLGVVRSVWTSDVDPTLRSSDSQTLKPGTRDVCLSMNRPGAIWLTGAYRVQLAAGNQTLATYGFSIKPAAGEAPLKTTDPRISFIYLNDDDNAETSRTEFPAQNDKRVVTLRVDTEKLPAGTKLDFVWNAVDIPRVPPGVLSAPSVKMTGEEPEEVSDLPPPPGRPYGAGVYRVDLKLDGKVVWSCPFRIRE